MTPKQAAESLGIDESRVRHMLANGELTGTKKGGRWHIDPRAVRYVLELRAEPRKGKGRPPKRGITHGEKETTGHHDIGGRD